MTMSTRQSLDSRRDVYTLEADMAFFEARLSLAGEAADTAYQRAQIRTYRALGQLLGETLSRLRDSAAGARGRAEGGQAGA